MTITQPQPQQGGTEKHASMRRKIGPIQRSDDPSLKKALRLCLCVLKGLAT